MQNFFWRIVYQWSVYIISYNDVLWLRYQYVYWFFVTHLNVIIDKHAPLKYKKVRQNNVPYMNSEFRKGQEINIFGQLSNLLSVLNAILKKT